MNMEKIIKGLYLISLDTRLKGFMTYWGSYHDVVTDAIKLLKAQEPRVLTLEELSDWDGAVMVEYTGTFNNPMFEWLLYQVQHNQDVMFSNHNRSNIVFDANDYGKGWRCWTSRPTDEQRKAVTWG